MGDGFCGICAQAALAPVVRKRRRFIQTSSHSILTAMSSSNTPLRRDFLKASVAIGFPAVMPAMQATKSLKVGLVGCGGRGSGAAAQALKADDYAQLTAVADVDRDRADQCLERLKAAAGP